MGQPAQNGRDISYWRCNRCWLPPRYSSKQGHRGITSISDFVTWCLCQLWHQQPWSRSVRDGSASSCRGRQRSFHGSTIPYQHLSLHIALTSKLVRPIRISVIPQKQASPLLCRMKIWSQVLIQCCFHLLVRLYQHYLRHHQSLQNAAGPQHKPKPRSSRT
jgi:hypothetical protein